jgi:pimeloyl-ACP methyl ester carboxylesterase
MTLTCTSAVESNYAVKCCGAFAGIAFTLGLSDNGPSVFHWEDTMAGNNAASEDVASENTTSRRGLMAGASVLGFAAAAAALSGEVAALPAPNRNQTPAPMNPGVSPIDRGFVRLAEGPVHYRYMDGRGRKPDLPVLLCHASPGSSERLAPLIPGLAKNRLVIAPDTLGNGDSPPPAMRETTIAYYVDATLRLMDSLELDRVDFYGTHTGAQIAAEMAVRDPKRIRKLILDGVPLFTDAYKKEALANYAPEMKPDAWGGHLMWAWSRSGDSKTPPEQRQESVMMQLKALTTYHIAYRAAFSHDVHALLPQITLPTLVMAIKRDPLSEFVDQAAAMIRNAQKELVETSPGIGGKLPTIQKFFGIPA